MVTFCKCRKKLQRLAASLYWCKIRRQMRGKDFDCAMEYIFCILPPGHQMCIQVGSSCNLHLPPSIFQFQFSVSVFQLSLPDPLPVAATPTKAIHSCRFLSTPKLRRPGSSMRQSCAQTLTRPCCLLYSLRPGGPSSVSHSPFCCCRPDP